MEKAIDRLRKFARYAREKGIVKGENSFEAYCGLSNGYFNSASRNNKGSVRSDTIALILEKFPELNVHWLCTGEGEMIVSCEEDVNMFYKEAYEAAMVQVKVLNDIISDLNTRMAAKDISTKTT